ncbi:hypothetical protein BV394_13690 [Brevirhabdus pacifica]|uniref:Uncharacterized protein n=1 Tax=Brevirhabdus pacifica TaxID=1267768 RepID=A0A1U7DL79_9RHOB|nr:Hint domain-containing protein [Brevirhabdus pacifica]APX90639.1 hypothetical protein BV394_13690 [Brevirhabdus pacifica]OWU78371.1 hypothetical protein ATO5_05775 [Loktanella sp. 22II-4b]PJJ85217.1 Hint domain-containing protein [Brevirhabdus pacifica]
MTTPSPTGSDAQSCQVYRAADFAVTLGANMGHPACAFDELNPGDIYRLVPGAAPLTLVHAGPGADEASIEGAGQTIAPGSEVGAPGDALLLSGRMTLMGDNGALLEVLLLTCGGESYVRPLSALGHSMEYTLIDADQRGENLDLAEVACVSFTRGTRITMRNGAQRPVEELAVGDEVLTRDHGPRPVRWIGAQTVRAHSHFAPIVITKGALNNAEDLILSPDHRLFIYQRRDEIGLGQTEVLIKAKYLVNDETIYQREGGFVDYFHLLFDEHEIIFAEGIAAESLMVNRHTLAALPDEMAGDLRQNHSDRAARQRRGLDASGTNFVGVDAAEALRRASGS